MINNFFFHKNNNICVFNNKTIINVKHYLCTGTLIFSDFVCKRMQLSLFIYLILNEKCLLLIIT